MTGGLKWQTPLKCKPVTSPVHALFHPRESSTLIPTREIQTSLFTLLSDEAAARGVNYVVDNMATIPNDMSNSAQALGAPASPTKEMTEAELVKMEDSLRDMYQQVYFSYSSIPNQEY